MVSPLSRIVDPCLTCVTRLPSSTLTLRSAKSRSTLLTSPAELPLSSLSPESMRVMENGAFPRTERTRIGRQKASSTPPAPPPTMVMRSGEGRGLGSGLGVRESFFSKVSEG